MSRRTRVDDYYPDYDDYPTRIYTGIRRPSRTDYYDSLEDDYIDRNEDYFHRRPSYPDRRIPPPPPLPRRGSNTSLSSYRRTHSYSMPQPSHYMDSSPPIHSPRYRRRSVHSVPTSPLMPHNEEVRRRPGFFLHENDGQYVPVDHRHSFQGFTSPQRMPAVFPMSHARVDGPIYPTHYFDPQPENDPGIWPSLAPFSTNGFQPMPMINPMINPMIPPVWIPPQPWPNAPEVPPVNENQPTEPAEPPQTNTQIQEEIKPKTRVVLPRQKSFLSGIFGLGETKEMKTAREYQKLGFFWCWRIIGPQQSGHFESFNITNQKYIKKKIEKGQGDAIFLNKEKKLPGIVLVDINQSRGCCMVRKDYYIQLELRREQYSQDSDQYIFSSDPESWLL